MLLEDFFKHMDLLLDIKVERLIIVVVIELQTLMAAIGFDYQTWNKIYFWRIKFIEE